MSDRSTPNLEYERHFQPKELAEAWSLCEDVIRELFAKEEGVLVLRNQPSRHKRRYNSMRIPKSVADRVYHRLTGRNVPC
jgi:hypothetical protein